MTDLTNWYGPTKECRPSCNGCVKCYRIARLIAEVRHGNHDAAMELAGRVERLVGNADVKPGTAAAFLLDRLEPVPAVALDALEVAGGRDDARGA